MKASLKKMSASLLVLTAFLISFGIALPAYAQTDSECDASTGSISEGAECVKPTNSATNLFGENGVFITVTNVLLFVIGAVAVIMLIIGGVRYVVSAGDQAAVTGAKNTIMYAIIGIVVAFLAYAAVNFVSSQLQSSTTESYKAAPSDMI